MPDENDELTICVADGKSPSVLIYERTVTDPVRREFFSVSPSQFLEKI